jgi:hypothetical protein
MMASWIHKGIEFFYDDDLDLSSWKSPEQIDVGFRLAFIHEVMTILDFSKTPIVPDDCPFKNVRRIWTGNLSPHRPEHKAMALDLITGNLYPSSFSNVKLLLLVRE